MIEVLTKKLADEYKARADKLPKNGNQDIGERRALRQEVQRRFGLNEVEAINLINGFHADLCIWKSRQRAIENGVTGGQENGNDEIQRVG